MTTTGPFQPILLYDSVFSIQCVGGYIIFLINKKIYVLVANVWASHIITEYKKLHGY